jgi:transposase
MDTIAIAADVPIFLGPVEKIRKRKRTDFPPDPLGLYGWPLLRINHVANDGVGFIGQKNAIGIRLAFQSGGQVYLAADDRVVHAIVASEISDVAEPRVDADAHPKWMLVSYAADEEAICEAVARANMRFVSTKTPKQQGGLVVHRTRHLFIRQQTVVINAIRAHLAEFGIVAPVGRKGVEELLHVVADPHDNRVPEVARACLAALGTQLLGLKEQILESDRMIMDWYRSNETSKRLHYIPGVGPLLATTLAASVADPKAFRSGRNFSAWIGLVPKQHSSGGKDRLGSISKQGDRYLRSLFVAGALSVIRYAKIHGTKHRPWLTALLARRPTKVAAIALANKLARMAWAMMARGERYRNPVALAT